VCRSEGIICLETCRYERTNYYLNY
jgi:hypothetical protein